MVGFANLRPEFSTDWKAVHVITSEEKYLDVSAEKLDVTIYQKTEFHIRPIQLTEGK